MEIEPDLESSTQEVRFPVMCNPIMSQYRNCTAIQILGKWKHIAEHYGLDSGGMDYNVIIMHSKRRWSIHLCKLSPSTGGCWNESNWNPSNSTEFTHSIF